MAMKNVNDIDKTRFRSVHFLQVVISGRKKHQKKLLSSFGTTLNCVLTSAISNDSEL